MTALALRSDSPAGPADILRDQAMASIPVFSADEVGWLAVEAGSCLAASGGASRLIRFGENSPMACLARDPRLTALAAMLRGEACRPVAAEMGRARSLHEPTRDALTLFVELGGGVQALPGTVRTCRDSLASDTLVVAVSFASDGSQPAAGGALSPSLSSSLWPPAAVVAG